MRQIIAWLFLCTLAGVETEPLSVLKVVDGDTVEAQALLGGVSWPVRVRLLWIDTPETSTNAHGDARPEGRTAAALLASLVGEGGSVRLWGPGQRLEVDTYGRALALAFPAAPGESLQERLIRAGLTVYWRKYGDAPEPYHSALLAAQRAAEVAGAGIWGTDPAWMIDKTNERTAPTVRPGPVAGASTPRPPAANPQPPPVKAAPAATHWLNTNSGARHNSGCRYFSNTKSGRMCGPEEGSACGKCGG